MSRAEQQALIAYPRDIEKKMSGTIDHNLTRRNAYIKGYGQAEQDMTLTWEDVLELMRLCDSVKTEWWFKDQKGIGTQRFFEEVLRRFNEKKHE